MYVPGDIQTTQRRLVWVSRNGAEQALAAPAREYDTPRLAPDGRRVAVEIGPQIWLYDLAQDTLTRLTFEGDLNNSPEWAPDGTRIAFYSTKDGPQKIFWQLADGSGGLERLTSGESGPQTPKSWSADGQLLAFQDISPTMQRDIWVLRLSDRKAEPFLRTPFIEGAPAFSPDGRWLAYVSNESGRPEIYVQPYPGPGGKWQISTDGGTEPVWSRNGREVFYRSGNKMMAVATTTQPGFSPGNPKCSSRESTLMKRFPAMGPAFDVSPDGQRFLMVKETEQAPSLTQINVVLNWFEELKRRVPTDGEGRVNRTVKSQRLLSHLAASVNGGDNGGCMVRKVLFSSQRWPFIGGPASAQDAKAVCGPRPRPWGIRSRFRSPEPAGTPPWGRALLRRRTGRDSR